MKEKPKLIRITTVPSSLKGLLEGQPRFMSENGFEVVGVSSSGHDLDDVTKNEGIRTVAVEMERHISLWNDLKSLIKLIFLFHKEKPVIVHSHTPKAGLLGMMAAWINRVPYRVHTVAGLPLTVATGMKRKVLDIAEILTYAFATNIYPNSYGLYNFILENKYTRSQKIKVIGNGSSNGVDTLRFDPGRISNDTITKLRAELGIEENNFTFLFVGRVVGDKGVNELITAFDQISKQYNTTHLIIVGNEEPQLDPLMPKTSEIIKNNDRIHVVGYRTNVADYFASANLFVFPSYREGFPNVVMQAAAMKVNAVVSDINGNNEIITDGMNGWVVPLHNIDVLRERMEWCLTHRDESYNMGLTSRKLMVEKYERSYVQEELLKEYTRLLKKEE